MILGITDTTHDSGAALVYRGKVICAINEERLTRKKGQGGFPLRSINKILEDTGIKNKEISAVVFAGISTPPIYARLFRILQSSSPKSLGVVLNKRSLSNYLYDLIRFKSATLKYKPSIDFTDFCLLGLLVKKDLPLFLAGKRCFFVGHHESHAAAACLTSGKEKVLCVTMDAVGDGLSATVSVFDKNKLYPVSSIGVSASLGLFYSMVTDYLGFNPFIEEGKTVGLAAFGKAQNVRVSFPFNFKSGRIFYNWKWGIGAIDYLKKLDKYPKEDVAAWLQSGLEHIVCDFIEEYILKTKINDIVLSGGVFANVKLNQRICHLDAVRSIYVFPHMGDGGLAVGSALYLSMKESSMDHIFEPLKDLYLGSEYSDDEIKSQLDRQRLSYTKPLNIEVQIAKLLAENKIVAVFDGRMEYGPRALGNRSILSSAKDKSINNILNDKLKRIDFMPFAPVTLKEYAVDCYTGISKAQYAALFMTITCDSTAYTQKVSPAVVHIDNTCRPQLISEGINPRMYRILKEYHVLTGIPSLINTSFNLHKEPIVCSPSDALKTFKESRLDYLAIGGYLLANVNSAR